MNVGLRIDVDTLRGTRDGVPALCRVLGEHSIQATFFFCVGPDNMGRHLWRLVRPAFLWKMLRTRAASLYGWDVLLRGVFWPGPLIGRRCGASIRAAAQAGHEVGLHAWDHHEWQMSVDAMSADAIRARLQQGAETLRAIVGSAPACAAAPAWKCDERVLAIKESLPFAYGSDCRGEAVFRPWIGGRPCRQPQVPVTLPTYDEAVGRNGVTTRNYNEFLLGLLKPDRLNVLTVHAEVEGIACLDMFDAFLRQARSQGAKFVALKTLLVPDGDLPAGRIVRGQLAGREGWLACQAPGVL